MHPSGPRLPPTAVLQFELLQQGLPARCTGKRRRGPGRLISAGAETTALGRYRRKAIGSRPRGASHLDAASGLGARLKADTIGKMDKRSDRSHPHLHQHTRSVYFYGFLDSP